MGSKNVSDGEVVLMNLTQMLIDSDDNIEIIPDEEYKRKDEQPTINMDVQDGEDGPDGDDAKPGIDGTQGEAGDPGEAGKAGSVGENGTNGSNGTAGPRVLQKSRRGRAVRERTRITVMSFSTRKRCRNLQQRLILLHLE